ncbi:hypothetical protein ACJIZ3_020427 [Penstemon smallii]|uniref:ABC transporter domain-containing protein n=1 Tax=Penstemon smallii TaxID=265156 RepID=A0ABD3SJF4_9LAMI
MYTVNLFSIAMSRTNEENDEENLIWAALDKLPIYDRLRTWILKSVNKTSDNENKVVHEMVDVRNLASHDRQKFINNVLKITDEDNDKFLKKLRNRIDEAGIELPNVEVRFKNLTVEADCFVGDKALPTLPNAARPPACGKTTLLLALSGRLNRSLKKSGEISYNGHEFNEFVPQKTSSYISQNDVHVAEMTVGETLDFAARCQGVGPRYELLKELTVREKESGVFPDAEVDLFMKATALEGVESSLITDYVLKILGLDDCRDTFVGNQMIRGISGGQKKRVTTGEMIVGPSKTLFMDEISTGLDSSTTFQVVKCMQQIAHYTNATILMSLLQPAPETFNLFDDVILLSEGQTVYHGPREHVTSKKDQEQYWVDRSEQYKYIPVGEFANRFKNFHVGVRLQEELSVSYDKKEDHKSALFYEKYLVPSKVLLKANFDKEWLLIKRNSFFYVFKTVQIIIVAIIASTVFLRTKLHTRNEDDGAVYIGALVFGMIINTFNGFVELSLTIERLPGFYKHRDQLFHPPWTFTLPNFLLRIPISLFESVVWIVTTYFTIGFAPEAIRFFKQLLWVFLIQQMAAGVFRLIAGICRTMIISKTGGSLTILLVFLLGGFILPIDQIPIWWRWGYWVSPLSYGYNAVTVNEMFASRWMNKLVSMITNSYIICFMTNSKASDNVTRLGVAVLNNFNIFPEEKLYWIGIVALLGFTLLFNLLFTFALMYLNPFEKKQGIISKVQATELESHKEKKYNDSLHRSLTKDSLLRSPANEINYIGSNDIDISDSDKDLEFKYHISNNIFLKLGTYGNEYLPKTGMVLPFTPLALSFDNVNYFVDMPLAMKEKGATEEKLQLLCEITGAFRPGVLTALMGVSGAGKTTLMDVLVGRKTRGYIEGDIRVSGFPKKQETFARISGYCEQNDIHSPQVTVHESLMYSAFLRLPKEVSDEDKMIFVDEVMHLVELDNLKEAIVGIPGVTGLSTEQRKRLTIAVELVANPSIIFMDEPTSGLDARAAAIVMRTVRNTVDTGRTVVCTIHQPGIDIFEAFDELLLMKRGGQVIYAGELGQNSQKIIDYFEAIPEVPKIKERCNPAAWMLEVTSASTEVQLGIDFGEQNKALVKELSTPQRGEKDVHFPSQYSQSSWGQFKYCLWKQQWTYWRNPDYNLSRFFFTFAAALMVGSIFWRIGGKRENSNDLMTLIGAMYASVLFVGINNCATIQPVVSIERTVFYREKAAGMYSALPYAMAQVIAEIPYVFVQTTYYTLIVYAMVGFEWKVAKFFWFFYVNFFSFLYFTYYGMMTVSMTPDLQAAAIFANAFYYLFNLFSGFFIPRPRIPKWWIWYYWICPMAWSVYGLIVSQYGDVEDTIRVPGETIKPSIKAYIEDHFGYNLNFMGPAAAVLICFTFLFAFMYAFCIKALNFQKR